MNSYAIDTHIAIEKLKAAGFQAGQAEVVASLFTNLDSQLATKDDLKTAISELRADITVLQEQIKSVRIESRIVMAVALALFAMIVPVLLRLFGLI